MTGLAAHFPAQAQPSLRVLHGGFQLAAVAQDARVGEHLGNFFFAPPREPVGVEVGEQFAEALAPFEHHGKVKAQLKGVQYQVLEQDAGFGDRLAPFVVVEGAHYWVSVRPGAVTGGQVGKVGDEHGPVTRRAGDSVTPGRRGAERCRHRKKT